MTKINIKEFTNYGRSEWLQFLRFQKTMVFEISLPKITVEEFDDRDAIFIEYFIACCIGQDLSYVSEDFMYSVPPVDAVGEFNFIVITGNFKKLATVLCSISNGFNLSGDPTPEFFDYALSFPERLAEDELVECGYLFQICEQFADSLDEEDDND